jgi:hypothetical protein
MANCQGQSALVKINGRQAPLRFQMIGLLGHNVTKQILRLQGSLYRKERQPVDGRSLNEKIASVLDLVKLVDGKVEMMFAKKGLAAQQSGVIAIAVRIQPPGQLVGYVRPSPSNGILALSESMTGERRLIPPRGRSYQRSKCSHQNERSDQEAL